MRSSAVITGATGGLGRAFVWEFANRGWDLVLTDRSDDALAVLAGGVSRAYDVEVSWRACDLSQDPQREDLIRWIETRESRAGALVNVAGFDVEGSFLGRDLDQLCTLMRVNMEAGVMLTHTLARQRTPAGQSDPVEPLRVINTASLAAFFPMPYKALYAASKGFIVSTSLALRQELRGRATVTVLCPAGMPTTPSAIDAIDAQGIIGKITTLNASRVAGITYEAAMRGRSVVIPGFVNHVLLAAAQFVPRNLLAAIIRKRWSTARGYESAPAQTELTAALDERRGA